MSVTKLGSSDGLQQLRWNERTEQVLQQIQTAIIKLRVTAGSRPGDIQDADSMLRIPLRKSDLSVFRLIQINTKNRLLLGLRQTLRKSRSPRQWQRTEDQSSVRISGVPTRSNRVVAAHRLDQRIVACDTPILGSPSSPTPAANRKPEPHRTIKRRTIDSGLSS